MSASILRLLFAYSEASHTRRSSSGCAGEQQDRQAYPSSIRELLGQRHEVLSVVWGSAVIFSNIRIRRWPLVPILWTLIIIYYWLAKSCNATSLRISILLTITLPSRRNSYRFCAIPTTNLSPNEVGGGRPSRVLSYICVNVSDIKFYDFQILSQNHETIVITSWIKDSFTCYGNPLSVVTQLNKVRNADVSCLLLTKNNPHQICSDL